ncbi:MAG: nucleoside-diphosphate sugar epimerase/dehydratase [Bacilli bacterium]|jgi:FlaA1/EpsC-like NDP-sugar epimerase|nr:nucleoside-diphosphate sugar epimerase/dehydratase [Bacilli bacterium]
MNKIRISIKKSKITKRGVLRFSLLTFSNILIFTILFFLGVIISDFEVTKITFLIWTFLILFKLVIFWIFNLRSIILTYFGIPDMLKLSLVSLSSSLIFWSIIETITQFSNIDFENINFFLFMLIAGIEVFSLIFLRFLKRFCIFIKSFNKKGPPTLIIGAGAAGRLVLGEISGSSLLNNNVIGFVDDDESKINRKILGKKIYGPISKTNELIKKYKVEEVIIAIANITDERFQEIVNLLKNEEIRLKRIPSILDTKANEKFGIINFSLDQLLNRDVVSFDSREIKELLEDRVVLITGAGGSIGSELSFQVLSHQPKHIILLDIYENGVYDVEQTIKRKIAHNSALENIKITTIIAATYNRERINQIFDTYKPEIIYHAAAYKHVPLMENNPQEAIRTNILGTFNIAEAANSHHVQKMIFVSTDKAVRPTNVMGATKRFAEIILNHFAKISKKTIFSSVRFGNVLGSSGSVIPLFEKQLQEGGPITITDPNIIRYFMTIPEAVSLILQSSVYAKTGEIFILDMGEPVKIIHLAENLIRQAGLIPYKDIQIEYIGLRPGEKLYEELLVDKTKAITTPNKKIFIESVTKNTFSEQNFELLVNAKHLSDNEKVKDALHKVIEDYQTLEENLK